MHSSQPGLLILSRLPLGRTPFHWSCYPGFHSRRNSFWTQVRVGSFVSDRSLVVASLFFWRWWGWNSDVLNHARAGESERPRDLSCFWKIPSFNIRYSTNIFFPLDNGNNFWISNFAVQDLLRYTTFSGRLSTASLLSVYILLPFLPCFCAPCFPISPTQVLFLFPLGLHLSSFSPRDFLGP